MCPLSILKPGTLDPFYIVKEALNFILYWTDSLQFNLHGDTDYFIDLSFQGHNERRCSSWQRKKIYQLHKNYISQWWFFVAVTNIIEKFRFGYQVSLILIVCKPWHNLNQTTCVKLRTWKNLFLCSYNIGYILRTDIERKWVWCLKKKLSPGPDI